jgi:transcriptional regulator GlxA family with amidase domain
MAKLTFWADEGCLFSGITGLVDAFAIANMWHAGGKLGERDRLLEAEVVTTGGKEVLAHGGFVIRPDRCMEEVDHTDMIFLPPFLPHVEPLPDNLDHMMEWVRFHYGHGVPVGTTCTGTFVLAETGLLDGRVATTNWYFTRLFRRRYPRVHLEPERVFTEDGGLMCSGASTAVFHLGLNVIERFGSPELAATCAKALLVDPSRDSQAPYMIPAFARKHGDSQVRQAQRRLENRYPEAVRIDTIAKEVGISPRHFKRRFKQATGETPIRYLQRVRIEAARKKLEFGKAPVTDITWQVGYEDASSFRRLFKRHTGLSPRAYRDKFSRQTA